jgi:hypothetical protein
VLAAANELYLEGGESLLRGLALFDLEWGNIQAGHAWVAAQADAADADVARLGMTYPNAGAYVLICGSTHASGFAGWKSPWPLPGDCSIERGEGAMRWATWALPTPTWARPAAPSSSMNKHCSLHREIGDRRGEGNALGNLGLPTPTGRDPPRHPVL